MENLESLFKEFEKANNLDELKNRIDEELSNMPSFDSSQSRLWEITYNYHRFQLKEGFKQLTLGIPTAFEFLGIVKE